MRMVMWAVPGSAILPSSCASDIRDSLVAAGLDFVEDSARAVLDAMIPLDLWLVPIWERVV